MHPPSPTAAASVQVVVRLRPLNDKEKKHGTLPVVSASTNDKSVTVIKGQGSRQVKTSYKFDNVFTAFSSQEEVFEATLQPVIRDVLMGFESTVFAYGQTGTGKTHTMEGDLNKAELHGVIPRSAAAIFHSLNQPQYLEYSVSCSFLEIYNEDLCDLLVDQHSTANHHGAAPAPKKVKLGIMEGKNGPFCRGLSESTVNSAQEVFALMRKAQNHRQVGETNMNKQSSRSHCIFTLKVQAKRKVQDGSILEVSGKLHCVDLAGSECAKSANLEKGNEVQAAREMERKNINRSLLTLGRVVSMLKEQSQGKKKNVRIPYRDSKLTRILQESLGGRCKTCLIATISPSITAIEESMSTLNYAQAANGIINKPITSSLMMTQPSSMGGANDRKGNEGSTGTVEHWQEMECRLQYMQSQVEEAQQALARKHLQQQELIERAERAETAKEEAETNLNKVEEEKVVLEAKVSEHEETIGELTSEVETTKRILKETTAVLNATQKTETLLTGEAKALISVVRKSIADGDSLYQQLVQNHTDEVERKNATRSFEGAVVSLLGELAAGTKQLQEMQKDSSASLLKQVEGSETRHDELVQHQEAVVTTMNDILRNAIASLTKSLSAENGLLPIMEETTANLREGLSAMEGKVSDHSTSIQSSCQTITKRLEEASTSLTDMEARNMELSTNMLQKLESDVMGAKENLASMVKSMTNALSEAKENRNVSRQNLRQLVGDWMDETNKSSLAIVDKCKNESAQVQAMLEMLASESHRHDAIEQELSQHLSQLEEFGAIQRSQLEKELQLLASQKASIENVSNQSAELCQQVMANIMSGVQDLVKTQMSLISKQQEEATASLLSTNSSLQTAHKEITDTSQTIQEDALRSNEIIKSHHKILRDVDTNAAKAMESTCAVLGEVSTDCLDLKKRSASLADSALQTILNDQSQDDQAVESMTKSMVDQGAECGAQLATRILQGAQENASELNQSSQMAISFARDEMENTVEEMSSSIRDVASAFETASKELNRETQTKLTTGEEAIQNCATEHAAQLQALGANYQTESSKLPGLFGDQRSTSQQHKESVVELLENQESAAGVAFDNSSQKTETAKNAVVSFSKDVIHSEAETAELSPRLVLDYSDVLSSTPAAESIIMALGEDSNKAEMDAENEEPTNDEGDKENMQEPIAVNKMTSNIPVLREHKNEQEPVEPESEPLKRRNNAEPTRTIPTRSKRVKTRR